MHMPVNLNYKGYKQIDFQELFINQNLLVVQTELHLSVKQSQQRNAGLFCGEHFLLGMNYGKQLTLDTATFSSCMLCMVFI